MDEWGPVAAWEHGPMTAHPLPAYAVPAPTAQLRVYEPLAAFPEGERERWRQYAAQGAAPTTERGLAIERAAGLRALLGLPASYLPDLPDQAYVTEVDGVTLVCPWRTRQRAEEALGEVRAELPDVLVDALVQRAVLDAAEQALDAWREQNPQAHVHVRSSTWQVPLRWFVLVDAEERQVSPGAPGPGAGAPAGRRTGRSLVYRTPMSRARRRTARALAVLRRSLDDPAATAGVEDLGRWLEEFHPRSLVELDYGGLVHLLDDQALQADDSAADVTAALAALTDGRADDAAAAYNRVTSRMKVLQAVESAG